MTELLRMGGDAAYVWSAYGITLAVLLLNAWWARWRLSRALERARGSAASGERVHRQPTVRQVQ
jgi:heme exporter protein CcmD